MPRASAITNLPLPVWGGVAPGSRRTPVAAGGRPGRLGGAGEIVAGIVLIVLWAVLWGVFVAGVVEPGAALRASAAEHPSLDAAAALPDARPGTEPGPVDTTGRAP